MNTQYNDGSKKFVVVSSTLKKGACYFEVNDKVLEALVESDPRTPVRELAKELAVSKSTVDNYLKQIDKSKNSITGCRMNSAKIREIEVTKSAQDLFFSL